MALATVVVVGALLSEWVNQHSGTYGAACQDACRERERLDGALLLGASMACTALLLRSAQLWTMRRSRGVWSKRPAPSSRPLDHAIAGLLLGAGIACAFAWSQVRTRLVGIDHIARLAPQSILGEGPLVRLRGVVLEAPATSVNAGSMQRFDRRPARWRFRVLVAELSAGGGAWKPCGGRVSVGLSSPERPALAEPGRRVELVGRLGGFLPRMNPGGFDARAWARRERLAAALWLEGPEAITLDRSVDRGVAAADAAHRRRSIATRLGDRLLEWRGELRALAEASLLHGVPDSTAPEIRALLVAMFLGRRDPALADLEGAFRRTGAAHLVAISGFNLAVLATAAMMLVRLGARHRQVPPRGRDRSRGRPASWVVMVIVATYLVVVEDQPAVLRAGAMILLASLGQALGRRWSALGVYCMAAVVLLLWRPADVANAGFQLSFAVVAALVWLTPRLQRRLFGRLERDGASLPAVVWRATAAAVAAAAAAWIVAMPLSLHHFGFISPLAGPLSLLAMPVASGLLVVGYVKMLLTPLLSWPGQLLGWPLTSLAETLAAMVRAADRLPGSVLQLPPPGALWTLGMLLALWVAIATNRRTYARVAWLGAILLALWPLRALVPRSDGPSLRVDVLAVGDGTCILVRSAGAAALFDAGSTNFAIGERTVVPALHALGVRRLDLLLISHANLDHFAAALEVVDALEVAEVLVPPHLLDLGERQPSGAAGALLAGLGQRDVPVRPAARGEERVLGASSWRWLHPATEDRPRRINDTSQVVLVEAAGARILLCGDIETEAMALLRNREPQLRADVVELPHHGSWREPAAAFVSALKPRLVVQSTGRKRALDERWDRPLEGVARLITARDGALWVEVDRGGGVTFGSMLRGRGALTSVQASTP